MLIEKFEYDLNPILEPVLLKLYFKKGPSSYIKLGDVDVPYN